MKRAGFLFQNGAWLTQALFKQAGIVVSADKDGQTVSWNYNKGQCVTAHHVKTSATCIR